MDLLVVIPARGGSKGIPQKNIYPLKGKPLLEYAIECIINSKISCTIAVSTDSNKIADVARNFSEVIVIDRPSKISGDTASTESALIHALEYMENEFGKSFDCVMTLPVTSPLRKPETVASFLEDYLKKKDIHDAQLTLHESYSDYWVKKLDGFERLYKNAPRRRQEREPMFVENSAIYITEVTSLIETNSVLGHNPTAFIIDEIEGADVNEVRDIFFIESCMDNNLKE